MQNAIYSRQQHKQIIEIYLEMCKQFAQEIATKTKYNNYLDVINTVIEYHNNYGQGAKENNFYDWLMILPINLS